MKLKLFTAVAILLCCGSCISKDETLGGNMIPVSHTYKVVAPAPLEIPVSMRASDSLSAYSSTRITIGAIRNDDEFGLSTRSSCITLVPMFVDTLDYGTNPVFKRFHFSVALDTVSVCDNSQSNILQNVYVYELTKQLDTNYTTYCASTPEHSEKTVTAGIPIINGTDSLSFDFSKEFAEKYMKITAEDVADINSYTKKFPGIYITTNQPHGRGGRFNLYNLQLDYDVDYGYLLGNLAKLRFNSTWKKKDSDGKFTGETETKDTTFYFYLSATGIYDIDSLLTNTKTSGNFPQYCANITTESSRSLAGKAEDVIYIDGGGGIKPVISARMLRDTVQKVISDNGHDPSRAVINKATITMHYMAPDEDFELMYKVPEVLSPTVRKRADTLYAFMGLTDSSDSDEDQGNIHRSRMTYSPDITYHLQSLLSLKDDDESLLNGSYDVWLLIMHNDVVVTTTSGNTEMSDYYNYLAYSSMMYGSYGGYGGYGGYGYGGYGNPYTNYYNYAMMAQYYGSSTTSSSTTLNLDRDRYYYCKLHGPGASDATLRPSFSFTYSIPNEQ